MNFEFVTQENNSTSHPLILALSEYANKELFFTIFRVVIQVNSSVLQTGLNIMLRVSC